MLAICIEASVWISGFIPFVDKKLRLMILLTATLVNITDKHKELIAEELRNIALFLRGL